MLKAYNIGSVSSEQSFCCFIHLLMEVKNLLTQDNDNFSLLEPDCTSKNFHYYPN